MNDILLAIAKLRVANVKLNANLYVANVGHVNQHAEVANKRSD